MVKVLPVAPPYRRLVYSQLAFTISSYALSAFSGGKSYRQLLKELLINPLNLQNTGVSPGNDSRAAIPLYDSWWGQDIQEETP
jgi:CubicO group peptidase (beta-lactamase class C family)